MPETPATPLPLTSLPLLLTPFTPTEAVVKAMPIGTVLAPASRAAGWPPQALASGPSTLLVKSGPSEKSEQEWWSIGEASFGPGCATPAINHDRVVLSYGNGALLDEAVYSAFAERIRTVTPPYPHEAVLLDVSKELAAMLAPTAPTAPAAVSVDIVNALPIGSIITMEDDRNSAGSLVGVKTALGSAQSWRIYSRRSYDKAYEGITLTPNLDRIVLHEGNGTIDEKLVKSLVELLKTESKTPWKESVNAAFAYLKAQPSVPAPPVAAQAAVFAPPVGEFLPTGEVTAAFPVGTVLGAVSMTDTCAPIAVKVAIPFDAWEGYRDPTDRTRPLSGCGVKPDAPRVVLFMPPPEGTVRFTDAQYHAARRLLTDGKCSDVLTRRERAAMLLRAFAAGAGDVQRNLDGGVLWTAEEAAAVPEGTVAAHVYADHHYVCIKRANGLWSRAADGGDVWAMHDVSLPFIVLGRSPIDAAWLEAARLAHVAYAAEFKSKSAAEGNPHAAAIKALREAMNAAPEPAVAAALTHAEIDALPVGTVIVPKTASDRRGWAMLVRTAEGWWNCLTNVKVGRQPPQIEWEQVYRPLMPTDSYVKAGQACADDASVTNAVLVGMLNEAMIGYADRLAKAEAIEALKAKAAASTEPATTAVEASMSQKIILSPWLLIAYPEGTRWERRELIDVLREDDGDDTPTAAVLGAPVTYMWVKGRSEGTSAYQDTPNTPAGRFNPADPVSIRTRQIEIDAALAAKGKYALLVDPGHTVGGASAVALWQGATLEDIAGVAVTERLQWAPSTTSGVAAGVAEALADAPATSPEKLASAWMLLSGGGWIRTAVVDGRPGQLLADASYTTEKVACDKALIDIGYILTLLHPFPSEPSRCIGSSTGGYILADPASPERVYAGGKLSRDLKAFAAAKAYERTLLAGKASTRKGYPQHRSEPHTITPKKEATMASEPEYDENGNPISTITDRLKDVGSRTLGDLQMGAALGVSQEVVDRVVDYLYPVLRDAFPVGTPEAVARKSIAVVAPIVLRVLFAVAPQYVPAYEQVDKALGLAITIESADALKKLFDLLRPLVSDLSSIVTASEAGKRTAKAALFEVPGFGREGAIDAEHVPSNGRSGGVS